MKNVELDQKKKAEIIDAFAKALDKNTSTFNDVWGIIRSLQESSEFLGETRFKYSSSLFFYLSAIKNELKGAPEHLVSLYNDMANTVSEALILAGQNAEGLVHINNKPLHDDLNAIIDEWNN